MPNKPRNIKDSPRRDPKENTTPLLLTGRCLAKDPTKERITSLLGRCLVTEPDPKENATVSQQQPQNRPKRKHFLIVGVFIGVCPAVI
jgi:hypothetical protein